MPMTLDDARKLVASTKTRGVLAAFDNETQAEIYAGMHPDAGFCVACCRPKLNIDRVTGSCGDCERDLAEWLDPSAGIPVSGRDAR